MPNPLQSLQDRQRQRREQRLHDLGDAIAADLAAVDALIAEAAIRRSDVIRRLKLLREFQGQAEHQEPTPS